ncbi:hypothetical protein [Fodinicola feengrottensis]|nr:hypothetical protein [Fodinicola feengrottensis]
MAAHRDLKVDTVDLHAPIFELADPHDLTIAARYGNSAALPSAL